MPTSHRALLASELPAEAFVRHGLALLESDFRTAALLALSDWEACGVSLPSLYSTITGLQRPSWGGWNGLLRGLRSARTEVLRGGRAEARARVEQARFLAALVAVLDRRLPRETVELLKPLAELTRFSLSKRARMGHALALPIALRNRVAHDAPTDPAWWARAATALHPLVELHAAPNESHADTLSPMGGLLAAETELLEHAPPCLRSPWFWNRGDGEVWGFNGVARDFAVIYAHPTRGSEFVEDTTQELLMAFQRLLGRTQILTRDLKKLLARLAPEEIRGVVMGDLLVGRPVGQGGFATVHVGRQLSTGRRVAVKILRDGVDEDIRARFQQEASFLSKFRHRHIVGVMGYGEDTWSKPRRVDLGGEAWFESFAKSAPVKSYIVLEWIEGRTLEQVYCDANAGTGRPTLKELARWFAQIASALQAVHASGLIHRDVKPGNIMVGDDPDPVTGHTVARLMDFGIARSQHDARTLVTTAGTTLGTDAYMSPEQLRAAHSDDEVGPAADIYALCATFYELLTGARLYAHDTADPDTVRTRKLRGDLPARPGRLTVDLPWELETIVLGGLQSEPADRYRSMAALERDLRHYLADEPIEYRRPGLLRRAQLVYRRATTAVHVSVLLVAILAGGIVLYVRDIQAERTRTAQEYDRAEAARGAALASAAAAESAAHLATERQHEAERALQAANDQLAALYEEQGRQARERSAWEAAAVYLSQSYVLGNRRPALRYLLARSLEDIEGRPRAIEHRDTVRAVSFDPSGEHLVTASDDGHARIWRVRDGGLELEVEHGPGLDGVEISPGGQLLVTRSGTNVHLWRMADGESIGMPAASELRSVVASAMAPTGDRLHVVVQSFVGRGGLRLETWGLEGRISQETVEMADARVELSPDGHHYIAIDGIVGSPHLYDLQTDREVAALYDGGRDIGAWYGFSADGRYAWVEAGLDDELRVYRASDGELLARLHDVHPAPAVAIDADRVVETRRHTLIVRSLPDNEPLAEIVDFEGYLDNLSFSTDGVWLYGSGDGQVAWVWDAASGELVAAFDHGSRVEDVALSPDRTHFVTAGGHRRALVWTPGLQVGPVRLSTHAALGALAFSPDGSRLLVGSDAGVVSQLPVVEPGRRGTARELVDLPETVTAIVWSPDASYAVVGTTHGDVRVLDAERGEARGRIEVGEAQKGAWGRTELEHPVQVAISSDGAYVLATDGARDIGVWTPDGERVATLALDEDDPRDRVVGLTWARIGDEARRLPLAVTRSGRLLAWTIEGTRVSQWSVSDEVLALSVSSDGETAVLACADGTARLWSLRGGAELARLDTQGEGAVQTAVIASDGRRVVTVGDEHRAIVWEGPDWRPRGVLDHSVEGLPREHPQQQVVAATFAPDRSLLATVTGGGDVVLWDADEGRRLDRFEGSGPVRRVEFSADGHWLAVAARDHSRMWYVGQESRAPGEVARRVAAGVALELVDGRLVPRR